MGQEYNIVSDAGEEHMQRVCLYVDGKFKEVSLRNGFLNTNMTAVLTAVNIAEDFLIISDDNLELSKKNKIANDEIKKLNETIEKLTKENEKLKKGGI